MKPLFATDDRIDNPYFIATVEDNVDPNNSYRVRVRIEGMHGDTILTNQLPWAAKVDSSFMGVGGTALSHSVPEVGAKVLVLAVNSNVNSLVYLGSLYTKASETPSGTSYLGTYGIYSQKGEFIGVDKVTGVLNALWKGDITVNASGNVSLTASALNVAAQSLIGDISSITTKGDSVLVDAPTVELGGSGGEYVVLVDKLIKQLDLWVAEFAAHTHTTDGVTSTVPTGALSLILSTAIASTTTTAV